MSQSLSSLLIHLVFSTKNRQPLIKPAVEPELYAYLTAIFQQCRSPSLIIGGTENHIHILFSLFRTASIAEVVERVKTSSSKWLKAQGAEFRHFQWQAGYGAFSIGHSNVAALTSYIAAQKAHHRRTRFEDEYHALLKKYRVEFDERYVWD